MYQMEEKKKISVIKKKKSAPSPVKAPVQMKLDAGVIQRVIKPIRDTRELASFLMPEDVPKITQYCRDKSYIISFRDAGVHTIRRLKDGTAAKGHHILEKSIKESSIGPDMIERIPPAVRGLVGMWSKIQGVRGLNALLGLYMSSKGIEKLKRVSKIPQKGQGVAFVSLAELVSVGAGSSKEVILEEIAKELKNSKSEKLEYSDFITGDYDLHDVLYVPRNGRTRGALITPAHAVKEGLNEALNGARKPHSEFDRIQHGPQSDYGRFITGHRGESFNSGLLYPDVGGEESKRIAVCGPDGKWFILHDRTELKKYYKKWGLNSNIVWPESEQGMELRKQSINAVRRERKKST